MGQIKELANKNLDFGFETTLAGKIYLRYFRFLKARGYNLRLFFLWIPDPLLAISRIKDRVAEGGHDIADKDIKRRFGRSIGNFFKTYRLLVDSWLLFDNSQRMPKLIAKKDNRHIDVLDSALFRKILSTLALPGLN
ncbi:MAG: hypothetical protein ACE5GG_00210 [Candidatus Omnitrophota bacterium]